MATQWEDLRKQARRLENELDLKLVSFSKLGTSYSSHSSDHTPLLSNSTSERMFETMAMEIEQLLAKLTGVNDMMAGHSDAVNGPSSVMHTLQRHRDILQDYTHEFAKTKGNIVAHREREDLIGSVRRDIDAYKNSTSGANNRRTDLYLKENEHLRNSDRLASEAIDIALATKENLGSQRKLFKNMTTRLNNLANRFPALNSLVRRIKMRKQRDSLIIGGVVAFCIILILLFWLH